jgi:sodium-dependent dicarboxylate transporter 2/3/5
MLPVGTPPNAIVFSSGLIKIHQMAKIGFIMNIIATIIVCLFAFLFF